MFLFLAFYFSILAYLKNSDTRYCFWSKIKSVLIFLVCIEFLNLFAEKIEIYLFLAFFFSILTYFKKW